MAIEIKEKHGIYELRGNLNAQNLMAIRTFFLHVLEQHSHVVVSVEQLESVDGSSLLFLRRLPELARSMGSQVTLVGLEHPVIELGDIHTGDRDNRK